MPCCCHMVGKSRCPKFPSLSNHTDKTIIRKAELHRQAPGFSFTISLRNQNGQRPLLSKRMYDVRDSTMSLRIPETISGQYHANADVIWYK